MQNLKINTLKYYLMILLVMLHASYIIEQTFYNKNSLSGLMGGGVYALVSVTCGMGLPCYFFISAYLFGNSFTVNDIGRKIISRIKTLIVPYVFWQIFWLFSYAILIHFNNKPFNIIDETYIPLTMRECLQFIYTGWRNPPLWYLKTIFGLVLISPSAIEVMKKSKTWAVIFIGILLSVNYGFMGKIPYASMFYWSPVYFMGLFCSIYYKSIFEIEHPFLSFISPFIILISVLILFILRWKDNILMLNYFKYSFWMVVSFLLIGAAQWFPKKELFTGQYNAQFFIYCVHYPFIHIITSFLSNFLGHTPLDLMIKFLCSVVLTVIFSHAIVFILSNTFPRAINIIYGRY